MDYFRENALLDYFSGGFDGNGEGLLLVHGSISRGLAPSFLERMQRVAQDFAQQHQSDQKLGEKEREGFTLLLAMRSWEFEAFAALAWIAPSSRLRAQPVPPRGAAPAARRSRFRGSCRISVTQSIACNYISQLRKYRIYW